MSIIYLAGQVNNIAVLSFLLTVSTSNFDRRTIDNAYIVVYNEIVSRLFLLKKEKNEIRIIGSRAVCFLKRRYSSILMLVITAKMFSAPEARTTATYIKLTEMRPTL